MSAHRLGCARHCAEAARTDPRPLSGNPDALAANPALSSIQHSDALSDWTMPSPIWSMGCPETKPARQARPAIRSSSR